MQVHVSNDAATSVATGALVVPVFAGGAVDGVAAEVDRVLGGAISDILAGGEITGKPNETSLVHAKDAPFKRALVIGLGEREKFNVSALAKYAGTAVRYLGKRGVTSITIALPAGADAALAASFIAEGATAATVDTTIYRTEADKPVLTTDVTILTGSHDRAAIEAGAKRGSVIGEAVNAARRMA
ncbi:MAG: pepA, partial [Candidatus Eremiobacteraeota bacterium]|nr:pepA [Candidatus Eremiobacteraeota bacterium]